jgi:alpha-beta hydrolase superfamily lysophospholipase
MLPFAWDITRRVRPRGVAVWQVHYRYRGWNGAEASPVADTRWALTEARRRYGDVPVVLLGHSMGGRVAVNVADEPTVRNLVLLAPWLPAGEAVDAVRRRRVLILHGDRDRTTRLTDSEAWALRAARVEADVEVHRIEGGDHAMLRRVHTWQTLAAQNVVRALRDCGALQS